MSHGAVVDEGAAVFARTDGGDEHGGAENTRLRIFALRRFSILNKSPEVLEWPLSVWACESSSQTADTTSCSRIPSAQATDQPNLNPKQKNSTCKTSLQCRATNSAVELESILRVRST